MLVAHVRCLVVMSLLTFASSALAQQGASGGQWRHYAGDGGSTKYAPIDQINADNVSRLKVAWLCDSLDDSIEGQKPSGRPENTPLYVNGTLYTSSKLSLVAAVDPETGKIKWIFNPESYKNGRPTNEGYVHRGFAYWTDGTQERLYLAAQDAYLWALDAKTGKPVEDFGDKGKVDLTAQIPGAVRARIYACSSPPVITRGVVIVGSSISDGPQRKEMPRGDIQAFDVKTGKPAWIFHSVPQQGEFGTETWENDAWKYSGNTNVWTCMSVDDELGYVYLPFGTPTNDWYGGQRLGDNLFGESLVCVDAATGKRVWHFQTVHHGLWDYDLPGHPVLGNVKVNGRDRKIVAQLTKSGFLFVLDRVNGEPIWPIEERPVPQSTVEGERTSPTQPFPTKPAPFERQGSTEDNLIDFTPELRSEALAILNQFDHGPIYTPPTEKGTINLPGWGGGANWSGAGFDPETGIYYIPSVTSPISVKLNRPDPARSNFTFTRGQSKPPEGPRGLPLFKPPYGRMTAIDLNTGDHLWMVPNGDGQRKKFSEIVGRDLGSLGSGSTGPLITKTLLFVAAGPGLQRSRAGAPIDVLRALDKKTGKTIAEVNLPGTPNGAPMTYLHGGKQYIVAAMMDGKLVAVSLP